MGAVDLRDVEWVLTNRIMEWHQEHYLCSTTGQCGVEVEGGTVPTRDWLLNLHILTSGGFR